MCFDNLSKQPEGCTWVQRSMYRQQEAETNVWATKLWEPDMFLQLFSRLLWEQSSTLNAESRQESQDYWGQMERSEPESPLVEGLPMKSLKHCKKPLLLKKTCKGKNGIEFSHLLFSFFNP